MAARRDAWNRFMALPQHLPYRREPLPEDASAKARHALAEKPNFQTHFANRTSGYAQVYKDISKRDRRG